VVRRATAESLQRAKSWLVKPPQAHWFFGSTVKEKLILDNSYHVVTVNYQKERVTAEVTRFFQRFAENRSAVL
jgi:esterase/lipase